MLLAFVVMLASVFASSATAGLKKEVLAKVQNAFKTGLYADALALGGHYEYDARKIKATGGFRDYSPPGEANNGIGWGQVCGRISCTPLNNRTNFYILLLSSGSTLLGVYACIGKLPPRQGRW